MLILFMWLVLFVPAQQIKTSGKNIKWQVASFSSPEKTGNTFPGFYWKRQIINPYLEQKFIAPDKKLILQGLPGIGNLGTAMPYEIFYFGCKNHFYTQQPRKNMLHGVPETGSNLVCVYQ